MPVNSFSERSHTCYEQNRFSVSDEKNCIKTYKSKFTSANFYFGAACTEISDIEGENEVQSRSIYGSWQRFLSNAIIVLLTFQILARVKLKATHFN